MSSSKAINVATMVRQTTEQERLTKVYRHILESLSVSVFLLAKNGTILYLNESAEVLIQVSSNRAHNLPLADFVSVGGDGANQDGLLLACEKSLQENTRIWLHDVEIAMPNGLPNQRVDCRVSPIDIDADTMLLLEMMPHDAGHIQSPSMGYFNANQTVIRGLAHEIRNPLGGMRGAAQLLADELRYKSGHQQFMQYTDIIIREADRLSDLVAQMQAPVSRRKKQSLNVHSVLEHVRHLTQSVGLSGTTISTDYDPSLPPIWGDSDQLIQAFINILSNAKAAVDGRGKRGCIVLKSRIDDQIMPTCEQQRQVVKVDVIDNGEGIDAVLLEHVFEPMVTGKPTGTGLGLSITAEIIRSHGGLITAQSKPGQTVFSVWLNIAEH